MAFKFTDVNEDSELDFNEIKNILKKLAEIVAGSI